MTRRNLLLQRIVGVLYILAGIGKFFPELESVEQRLDDAADANGGAAVLGPFTEWLADHPMGVTVFVAAAMVASGAVLILNQKLVVAAIYGQLLMMVCFVIILVSSAPQILVLDAAFFAAAIYLLVLHRRAPSPSTSPGATARAGNDNRS
ncbi:DUF6041 domain-containing protein [Streptomyces sp. NBC_00878]|uniref:DUF6041 domain-containing protein n=1 Tax=Streptomyces sp. NBC_00878 TaxID=2975854 RepID=UPI0022577C72|nr:DUF6041 domain-containing protein [Streptomyces sp. NBC_00878]MCX4911602.1 DUF6041 domain-containing protein [Streptomyces sp. NBC_00878]